MAKPKRPRDLNQLAVHVGKIATGEITDAETNVSPATSNEGRRKNSAPKAAMARWGKGKKK